MNLLQSFIILQWKDSYDLIVYKKVNLSGSPKTFFYTLNFWKEWQLNVNEITNMKYSCLTFEKGSQLITCLDSVVGE